MSSVPKPGGPNTRVPLLVALIVVLALSQAWATRHRAEKAARLALDRAASAAQATAAGTPAGVPAAAAAAASGFAAPAPAPPVSQSLAALRAAPWGEDPFWKAPIRRLHPGPRGPRTEPPPAFVLRGILSGGTASSAQIGESMVQVGDAVSGWTVTSIDNNSVTLARGAAHVTLHLHEDRP